MENILNRIKKQESIRRSEESDPAIDPKSESAFKIWAAQPTKSDYKQYEFDETVYKDLVTSNLLGATFQWKENILSMRQAEAIHWLLLGYPGLATICNAETRFELALSNSRDGAMNNLTLSTIQRATVKQFKKTIGEDKDRFKNMTTPQSREEEF